MRIAVFGGHAPSLLNFRGPMLKALVDRGHRVFGLAPDFDPVTTGDLEAMGVACRTVALTRTGINPVRDLLTLASLARVLREVRPDLLLSYTIKPVIYGGLVAALLGVPRRHAMITGLGSALQGSGFRMGVLGALTKWLYRQGISRNHGIFFQNPDDRAFFDRNRLLASGCRVTLIDGSGVDLDRFAPAPLPAGPPRFLMMARLTRDKGVLDFVAAARILKGLHPEAECRILGPLDTNPTAITRADLGDWETEGVIRYLGERTDVRPELAEAHALVLPSYGEGTPHSVLEAMATGRAIVTTDAPGCRETVLEGRTGFLVPVRDPGALARAMARFCEDPSLAARMGPESRTYAETRYDVHRVNGAILGALGLS
jgi:glycosyltransferase involved in cell wall biosynthesis